jgi:hypothetical protein
VVTLCDGRTLRTPLRWYPRLAQATAADQRCWRLIGRGIGIHWPRLDEDISVEGMLRRVPAPGATRRAPTRRGRRRRPRPGR